MYQLQSETLVKGDVFMRCNTIAALIAAIFVCVLPASAAQTSPKKIFDVRQSGAKGDGTALDTAAIQSALDQCEKAGGGIVRLTAGTYLSKPIYLTSNTELNLEEGAVLKATDEPADFADPDKPGKVVAFINGKKLENVSITGKGTIDGSGQRWWPAAMEAKNAKKKETLARPHMIIIERTENLLIEGVTLTNSPKFHLIPKDCQNIVIDGVTFLSPDESPNTDAIDPSTSRNVVIKNCQIDVGDDNVAVKSGRKNPDFPDEPGCQDITVSDCKFLHGHGMSIGSETAGGVKNLTAERITFENTDNGARIKSYQGRGGLVENITFSDMTMTNVKTPILISGYYPKIPDEDTADPVTDTTPVYHNITIKNLTATSPKYAGFIVGLPGAPLKNITLENVSIKAPKGLTIRNAQVNLKNVKIEVEQGPPFILQNNAEVTGLPE